MSQRHRGRGVAVIRTIDGRETGISAFSDITGRRPVDETRRTG
jgi:hypothetical protein